jgi:hypothetical protein
MTNLPQTPPSSPSRAEKLSAIAAVFGEATAARIGAGALPDGAKAADADRLAWQTNRLIQHLRDRVDTGGSSPQPQDALKRTMHSGGRPVAHRTATEHTPTPQERKAALPVLVAGEDLAAEHPAVIARILKSEPQTVRVSVLRALPGHVSRAVMRRLRTG